MANKSILYYHLGSLANIYLKTYIYLAMHISAFDDEGANAEFLT